MKDKIDRTVKRIGQLPDGPKHFAIFQDSVHKQHPSVALSAKGLKDLATAYTQLKADLATAKQGLEHYADESNFGNSLVMSDDDVLTSSDIDDWYNEGRDGYLVAQQTLAAIGKEWSFPTSP